jgi:hypothetical protein
MFQTFVGAIKGVGMYMAAVSGFTVCARIFFYVGVYLHKASVEVRVL